MRRNSNNLPKALLVLGIFSASILPAGVFAQTPSLNVPTSSLTATPSETPSPSAIPTLITAAEPNIIVTTSVGTQYPWNKRIPLKIKVTPRVSGQRLDIRWQSRASVTGKPETITILQPQAGKTYTFKFTLTPHTPGYQRATADIILTTTSTNYVSSTNIPLQFNSDNVVIPITASYIFYQTMMYASLALFFLVALPFFIYQFYRYSKNVLIPRWLESRIKKPL